MSSILRNLSIFLLSTLTISGCKSEKRGGKMPPPLVEVTVAVKDSIANSMEFISRTTSNNNVLIIPRVNGYIISIEFNNGMPVRRGDILYKIDPSTINSEVASARAQVSKANAQLVEAKNNYQRAVPLAKIDAISQSMLDQYEAVYKSAKASLKAATAELNEVELNMGYTTIIAPIDGIISQNELTVGQYVGPNSEFSTLNTISSIDSLNVAISIPVSEYLQIVTTDSTNYTSFNNANLLSNIRLYLSDGSLYPYFGEYLYTQKNIGAQMGTLEIVTSFPNNNGVLKAGQFARIKADVGDKTEVVLVPQVCVSQLEGLNSVWIVDKDGKALFREVTLGKTIGKQWVIKSGISEGDRVVSSGQMKLHSGEEVRVKTSKTSGNV